MLIMINTYLDIILRSAAVYFFVFIAIRITGKKEISQLSIVDFVLVILVSNAVQNSMVGPDTSLVGRNRKAKRLLEGVPVLLVYKGKRMDKNLASEKISNDELDAAIRAHGILSTDHVAMAVLETNGLISVIAAD